MAYATQKTEKGTEDRIDYNQTLGYQKLIAHYSAWTTDGWQFDSNCHNSNTGSASLSHRIKDLAAKGLEVYVGDLTFNPNGTISKSAVPIFTKPISK